VLGLALPAGIASDRYPRRRVAIAAHLTLMSASAALMALSWFHGPTWAYYVALLAMGTGMAFRGPSVGAMLPQLVPSRDFANANAWFSSTYELASISGPAVAGFLIGSTLGSLCGLLLWLSPGFAAVVRPVMIAINGVPKIALAPLIIVWFGIGMEAKIAIAAILTFIVSLIATFAGTREVDQDLIRLMRSLGASRFQTWRKVVAPATLPWIVSALRLNVGFALIGAVVGEYISAREGLGYLVYFSGTLYDLNAVWTGIFALMALALVLDRCVTFIESKARWA
jgi:NitT/TauT family transport system permease protein